MKEEQLAAALARQWNYETAIEGARYGGTLTWEQWFRLLAEADDTDVAEVENLLVAGVKSQLTRMAAGIVNENRMQQNRFYPDAHSIVMGELVTMLRQVRTTGLEGVSSHRAVLKVRATRAFSVFLESSSGLNPASGMANVRRRRNAIHQTRVRLAEEYGRAPSDEELIEVTNKRMAANRSDARKQGMFVTKDDLQPIAPAAAFDPDIDSGHTGAAAETVIEAVDRKTLARKVLDHARANESELHQVICRYIWGHQLLDDPPPPVLTRDLSRDFPDVDAKVLSGLYKLFMRDLPRQILRDDFGVTGTNPSSEVQP